MTTQDPDGLPPECRLIYSKRNELGLSIREAARRAGSPRMPEGTWRQNEKGTHGHPASWLLARQALVVQATPAQLQDSGRKDAADDLRTLMQKQIEAAPGIPGDLRAAVADDARAGGDGLLVDMALTIAEIEASPYLTKRDKADVREEFLTGIARDIGERRAHVHTVLRVAQSDDVG